MRGTTDILNIGWNGRKFSIPHYVNRKITSVRYRIHPDYRMDKESKFTSLAGRPFSKPWPWDYFNFTHEGVKAIFVTEGEFDAITILQAGLPCVSLPSGVGTKLDKWLSFFKQFEIIFLCYDQDAAGERGWKKAQETGLPVQRIKWNKARGKDVNDARSWLLPRLERLYAKAIQEEA